MGSAPASADKQRRAREIIELAQAIDNVIHRKRFGLRCAALVTLLAHYIAFETAGRGQPLAVNVVVEELREKLELYMKHLAGPGPTA